MSWARNDHFSRSNNPQLLRYQCFLERSTARGAGARCLSTPSYIAPIMLKTNGLVGAGRFERPPPCAQGARVGSKGSIIFRLFQMLTAIWGICFFAQKASQTAPTDAVRTQFWHSEKAAASPALTPCVSVRGATRSEMYLRWYDIIDLYSSSGEPDTKSFGYPVGRHRQLQIAQSVA